MIKNNTQQELRRLIKNFKPYDKQETSDKAVILKWIDNFDNLLSRENEFAHFCGSAFVVNKKRDKALMIYHNIYNSWACTGGHADGEVDMLSVALREAREETGIKNIKPITTEIFLLDTLPILGHVKKGKYVSAHIHLSVTYIAEADENEPLTIKEDENSGVQWIPISEIIEKSTEPHMKHVYKKAIEKLKTHR